VSTSIAAVKPAVSETVARAIDRLRAQAEARPREPHHDEPHLPPTDEDLRKEFANLDLSDRASDGPFRLRLINPRTFFEPESRVVVSGQSRGGKTSLIYWTAHMRNLPRAIAMCPSPEGANAYAPLIGRPYVFSDLNEHTLLVMHCTQKIIMDRINRQVLAVSKARKAEEDAANLAELEKKQKAIRARYTEPSDLERKLAVAVVQQAKLAEQNDAKREADMEALRLYLK
jgi:hypothetical protein